MTAITTKTVVQGQPDSPQHQDLPTAASRAAVLRQSTSTIIPFARYGAQRIGTAGVIGIALLIFSVMTFMSGNVPMKQSLTDQRAALEAARSNAAEQRAGTMQQSPDQQAATFVAELPGINDVPAIMGSVVAIAAVSGIELERGSYEHVIKDGDSISSYQMALPIIGTYPEVRKFVEDVLAAEPALALQSMRIERNTVSNQIISADLRFAVLLGESS